jgi:hypothetical protein
MLRTFILTVVCCSLGSAFAMASEFNCPTRIKTKQSAISKPGGWEAFNDISAVHHLRKVDFYDGNPKKMVQLAPDNPNSAGDPSWSFGSTGLEAWMVCRYTETRITMAKRLPNGLKSCEVKYSKDNPPQVTAVTCK